MPPPPIAILETGLVCGVGLDAPSACAAMRCAIDNFAETRFMDEGGEWIVGSSVTLQKPWRGCAKLARMLAMAAEECLVAAGLEDTSAVPLLLCVAEEARPGRQDGLEDELYHDFLDVLGRSFASQHSAIIPQGRVGTALALERARRLIYDEGFPYVLIAAADSLLVGPTLTAFEQVGRLKTSQNSDGFIPGEAAGALLVGRPRSGGAGQLLCTGIGFGTEPVTVDAEAPLRGDGLSQAIRAAMAEAGCAVGGMDFRITDNSGEQYYFKEASLALSRTMRERKEHLHLWHPADCIGEVGAAIGPAILATALASQRKGYGHGPIVLSHSGNDAGQRAATILQYQAAGVA